MLVSSGTNLQIGGKISSVPRYDHLQTIKRAGVYPGVACALFVSPARSSPQRCWSPTRRRPLIGGRAATRPCGGDRVREPRARRHPHLRTAPSFSRLAALYAQATNYHAVSHPSLPNYLALVSGSTHGVTNDCTDCPQSGPTIGSQLSARHRSWARLRRGISGLLPLREKARPVPLLPERTPPMCSTCSASIPKCSRRTRSSCPTSAMTCTTARSRPVTAGCARFILPLLTVKNTAVFIVFDEGTTDSGGGGKSPRSSPAQPCARTPSSGLRRRTTGFLRTIESALGLPFLGRARSATPLTGIWR